MNAAPAPQEGETNAGLDRVSEVEIKLAYLDDLLDALNGTVYRQQQKIDLLTQAVAELRRHVRSADPGPGADPRDNIPPHY